MSRADDLSVLSVAEGISGVPIRLKIPSLDVDAKVEPVGLTSDGAMDVPSNPDSVAWFKSGSRPGNGGAAVLAGHNVWQGGAPAVFGDLHKLRKGDHLSIEDDTKTMIDFVVIEARVYDYNADTSEVFFSNDGKARLNLITCDGVWDQVSKRYPQRLVVFAERG